MPTYSIQGPDGRTYSIDGPAGASREQVIAEIQRQNGGKIGAAPARKPSMGGDFMRPIKEAGTRLIEGVKDDYARSQRIVRGKENPNVLSLGGGPALAGNALALAASPIQGAVDATVARPAARAAIGAGLPVYERRNALTIPKEAPRRAYGQEAEDIVAGDVNLALSGGKVGPVKARAPVAPKPAVRGPREVLAEVGVSTSIPQGMGRVAKSVEDLGKRAPILGQAMSGYQDRQIEQLNRAIGLKALQPVGLGIPKDVKPGFEMVEFVDDALGKVYDKAARLAPRVSLDEQLVQDAQRIGARRADLAESEARQFDSIVGDRLARLQSGEASGAMVKQIHGELGKLQAEAARKGQATLAAMLGDTRRAVMGVVERASPEARKLIAKADEGWRIYSMMNDAAASASARGGIFLPGQLNTQVRRAAKGMGSNMAGKGKGPLQEIATAATQTIPDSYGNPGTANALGLGAGGVGLLTEPTTTLTAGAALTAAATPYFLAGRKVLEALPATASRAELLAADRKLAQLASKDPAVSELRRRLAAMLSGAVAGSAGANSLSSPETQRNALAAR